MSYEDIVEGLAERCVTVSGLDGTSQVLLFEPTSISPKAGRPVMYFLLNSFERVREGTLVQMRYRITARLCFLWQNNQAAEAELRPFVNSVPAAIDADQKLGARLNSNGTTYKGGLAYVTGAEVVYVDFSETIRYKCVDFAIDAHEKFVISLAGTGGL